jgi:hypothetical protein
MYPHLAFYIHRNPCIMNIITKPRCIDNAIAVIAINRYYSPLNLCCFQSAGMLFLLLSRSILSLACLFKLLSKVWISS